MRGFVARGLHAGLDWARRFGGVAGGDFGVAVFRADGVFASVRRRRRVLALIAPAQSGLGDDRRDDGARVVRSRIRRRHPGVGGHCGGGRGLDCGAVFRPPPARGIVDCLRDLLRHLRVFVAVSVFAHRRFGRRRGLVGAVAAGLSDLAAKRKHAADGRADNQNGGRRKRLRATA